MISIPYLICSILSFVPAIVCHEACHGFAAYKLGDPTAKRAGRLSFNPLKHIDPFGTVIMPLLLMAMNMPVFGYAKPVPYNPAYFKDPRKGDLIVGLAGPAANLVLAVLGAVVYTLVTLVLPVSALAQNDVFYYFLTLFLPMFSLINLYLMFFNLLPIPPLDGGRFVIEVFQKISRKVVTMRALNYLSAAGMILFIGFFLFMANQDIQRIISGAGFGG